MSLLTGHRLGRLGFILVVICMLGFDEIKDPIAGFLMQRHDVAADRALGDDPAAPHPRKVPSFADTAKNLDKYPPGGRHPPLQIQSQSQFDYILANKDLSPEEFAEKLKSDLDDMAGMGMRPPTTEVGQQVAAMRLYENLYIIAAIATTGITFAVVLWMVTARVRDIGWSSLVTIIVLAFYFAPRLMAGQMPPLASEASVIAFQISTALLAIIPSEGHGWLGPPKVRHSIRTPTVTARPGQFGRRGVSH